MALLRFNLDASVAEGFEVMVPAGDSLYIPVSIPYKQGSARPLIAISCLGNATASTTTNKKSSLEAAFNAGNMINPATIGWSPSSRIVGGSVGLQDDVIGQFVTGILIVAAANTIVSGGV